MEYRLLECHTMRQESYRFYLDSWQANMLINLFMVTAVGADIQEGSRTLVTNTVSQRFKSISDIVDPFKYLNRDKNTSQEIPKLTDEGRISYLKALSKKGGYASLTQLMQAIRGLNNTLKDMQHADSRTTASDD